MEKHNGGKSIKHREVSGGGGQGSKMCESDCISLYQSDCTTLYKHGLSVMAMSRWR